MFALRSYCVRGRSMQFTQLISGGNFDTFLRDCGTHVSHCDALVFVLNQFFLCREICLAAENRKRSRQPFTPVHTNRESQTGDPAELLLLSH